MEWRDITSLALHPVTRLRIRRDGPVVTLSVYGVQTVAGNRPLLGSATLPSWLRPDGTLAAQGVIVANDIGSRILGKLQPSSVGAIEWKCPETSSEAGYAYMTYTNPEPIPAPASWPGSSIT